MADPSKAASNRRQRLWIAGGFAVLGSLHLVIGRTWFGVGFMVLAALSVGLALRS